MWQTCACEVAFHEGNTVNKRVEEGAVLRSICVYIRPILNMVKVNKHL